MHDHSYIVYAGGRAFKALYFYGRLRQTLHSSSLWSIWYNTYSCTFIVLIFGRLYLLSVDNKQDQTCVVFVIGSVSFSFTGVSVGEILWRSCTETKIVSLNTLLALMALEIVAMTTYRDNKVVKLTILCFQCTVYIYIFVNSLWRHMSSDILVSIGSGNGLAPVWCQAITWTNADLL